MLEESKIDIVKLIEDLNSIIPTQLHELIAAIELVGDELKYTKAEIDKKLQVYANCQDYSKCTNCLQISKELSKYLDDINRYININSLEYNKVSDEYCEVSDEERIDNEDKSPVEYESFKEDEYIMCDLFSIFTHKKPVAFSFKQKIYMVSNWRKMLILMCELLCTENKNLFLSFASDKTLQGKKMPRFTQDKSKLRVFEKVKGSDIFIELNLSANDIRKEILAMLKKYNIATDAVVIYLAKESSSI